MLQIIRASLLITLAHSAVAASKCNALSGRTKRVLRVCTHLSPGFNDIADSATLEAVQAGIVAAGKNGYLVQESMMAGYMSDMRKLVFNGTTPNAASKFYPDNGNSFCQAYDYELRLFASYKHTVYYTKSGYCDIGWAPMTITGPREACPQACYGNATKVPSAVNTLHVAEGSEKPDQCCVDFPHATVKSGLAILFEKDLLPFFLFDPRLLNIMTMTTTFIIIFAHLAWLAERKSNSKQFPVHYWDGIDDGLWWSAVTITTVGYGDKCPTTPMGRWVGFFWMFGGIVLAGMFTGTVTQVLVSRDDSVRNMDSVGKFHGQKMCTTAAYWNDLGKQFFIPETGSSLADCLDKLTKHEVQAVYYDKPQLIKWVATRRADTQALAASSGKTYYISPHLAPLDLCPVFRDERNTAPGIGNRPDIFARFNTNTLALKKIGVLDALFEYHFAEAEADAKDTVDMRFVWPIAAFGCLYTISLFVHKWAKFKGKQPSEDDKKLVVDNVAHVSHEVAKLNTKVDALIEALRASGHIGSAPQSMEPNPIPAVAESLTALAQRYQPRELVPSTSV